MENENISDSGGMDEWQEIQSLSSSDDDEAQWYKDENLVIVGEGLLSDSAVFPPKSHLGLPVAAPSEKQPNDGLHPSCSSDSLSSDCDDANGIGKGEGEPVKDETPSWIGINLGLLSSRIVKFASQMRKYITVYGASVWLFALATTSGGTILLFVMLFMRAKKWQRQGNKKDLMLLIKEKDQRVNQLLLEMSQLNEVLLAHRRVPVLRVG